MCAFCGKIDKNFLCENCKKEIERIEKFHQDKYTSKEYNEHIYMFEYKKIRNKILDYKFDDRAYYYKTFVNILLNNKKMCEILKSYDIIIPVPIHNKRRKERGYNQTELIAKEIAKSIDGLEYANILIKDKNTVPQSTLNKRERAVNTQNIYKLKYEAQAETIQENNSSQKNNLFQRSNASKKKNLLQEEYFSQAKIQQKRVLIFDDIYTTGATANECAKIIKKLKPSKIGILTIAKD